MADPDAEAEIPQPEELARKHHMSVEATISYWSAGFSYILDLGDVARRLTRNSPERSGKLRAHVLLTSLASPGLAHVSPDDRTKGPVCAARDVGRSG
jgi:hypothetical protein